MYNVRNTGPIKLKSCKYTFIVKLLGICPPISEKEGYLLNKKMFCFVFAVGVFSSIEAS
jgi:hypothetical protein